MFCNTRSYKHKNENVKILEKQNTNCKFCYFTCSIFMLVLINQSIIFPVFVMLCMSYCTTFGCSQLKSSWHESCKSCTRYEYDMDGSSNTNWRFLSIRSSTIARFRWSITTICINGKFFVCPTVILCGFHTCVNVRIYVRQSGMMSLILFCIFFCIFILYSLARNLVWFFYLIFFWVFSIFIFYSFFLVSHTQIQQHLILLAIKICL